MAEWPPFVDAISNLATPLHLTDIRQVHEIQLKLVNCHILSVTVKKSSGFILGSKAVEPRRQNFRL